MRNGLLLILWRDREHGLRLSKASSRYRHLKGNRYTTTEAWIKDDSFALQWLTNVVKEANNCQLNFI